MIRKSTWIVLGVFFLLLGLAWYLQRGEGLGAGGGTATPLPESVLAVPPENITNLRIATSDREDISLSRDTEGVWRLDPMGAEETDQERISAAIRQVASLRVLSSIDPVPSMKDLGLEPPVYTLTMQLNAGTEEVIYIGDSTPTDSGYYVLQKGAQPKIVLKAGIDAVVNLLTDPPVRPTQTSIPEAITTDQP